MEDEMENEGLIPASLKSLSDYNLFKRGKAT
jgi:hypothetical protein